MIRKFLNLIFGTTMGSVKVNGQTFEGDNISISGNKVYIDGKLVNEGDSSDKSGIKIIVQSGTFNKIQSDESLNISGKVIGNIKALGSVNCDDVQGHITSRGSVNCDDVYGDISAKGSVNCDDVHGTIKI
jgi:hypothetical protein